MHSVVHRRTVRTSFQQCNAHSTGTSPQESIGQERFPLEAGMDDESLPYFASAAVDYGKNAVLPPPHLPENTILVDEKPPALSRKHSMGKDKLTGQNNNKKGGVHKEGVFSPIVVATKNVLGDEKLNKLRGNVISLHSDIIGKFVESSSTDFGQAVLARLFALADKKKDGALDTDELANALHVLGFSWLKEKQIMGIVKRADTDKNGVIDFEEFLREAPKTLRTNLVKLAKKNGGEMGLLV